MCHQKGLVSNSIPNTDPKTWRESAGRIFNAWRHTEERGAVRRYYRRKYRNYMFHHFSRHLFSAGAVGSFIIFSYCLAHSKSIAIIFRLPTDDPNKLMNSPEFLHERNELMMRRAEHSKRMQESTLVERRNQAGSE
jgi:hypothetical protein